MKKTIINIFIILFLISIYKDLTFGTNISTNKSMETNQTNTMDKQEYEVIKVKMEAGDTVLSIMERINTASSTIDINLMLQDFSLLNPNIDPNQLQTNHFYFFPKYNLN